MEWYNGNENRIFLNDRTLAIVTNESEPKVIATVTDGHITTVAKGFKVVILKKDLDKNNSLIPLTKFGLGKLQ